MIRDLFLRHASWLHTRDPRAKILFVLLVTVYAIAEQRPWPLLGLLVGLHGLARWGARAPWRVLGGVWHSLLPVIVLILVVGGWHPGTGGWITIGPLTLDATSWLRAVGIVARVVSLALVYAFLLWTTEPGLLEEGLVRLGVPFPAALMVTMALQYVATFAGTFREVLDAQQSRGLVIPRHNPLKALRAYLPVAVPVIVIALRTADQLALALQARGFGGTTRRVSRRKLCWALHDTLLVGGGLLLLGVLFALR